MNFVINLCRKAQFDKWLGQHLFWDITANISSFFPALLVLACEAKSDKSQGKKKATYDICDILSHLISVISALFQLLWKHFRKNNEKISQVTFDTFKSCKIVNKMCHLSLTYYFNSK